jgi:hypothetical protein
LGVSPLCYGLIMAELAPTGKSYTESRSAILKQKSGGARRIENKLQFRHKEFLPFEGLYWKQDLGKPILLNGLQLAKWFEVTFMVLETQAKKTNKRTAGVPNDYEIVVTISVNEALARISSLQVHCGDNTWVNQKRLRQIGEALPQLTTQAIYAFVTAMSYDPKKINKNIPLDKRNSTHFGWVRGFGAQFKAHPNQIKTPKDVEAFKEVAKQLTKATNLGNKRVNIPLKQIAEAYLGEIRSGNPHPTKAVYMYLESRYGSVMSERTLQRRLTELEAQGLIPKAKHKGKARKLSNERGK